MEIKEYFQYFNSYNKIVNLGTNQKLYIYAIVSHTVLAGKLRFLAPVGPLY